MRSLVAGSCLRTNLAFFFTSVFAEGGGREDTEGGTYTYTPSLLARHSFSSCQLLCLCTHTSHFVPFHALWHKKSNELHPYHLSLKFGSNTGCTEHLLGFDKYCIGCHIWKRITGDEIPWKDQNRQCVLCLSNFHLPQPACGFQHLASTVQWCDSLMCALIVSGQ